MEDEKPYHSNQNAVMEASEMANQDEGSWMNVQNPGNVETPAFNSKVFELPPNESVDEAYN
jgi:hypothetical protein